MVIHVRVVTLIEGAFGNTMSIVNTAKIDKDQNHAQQQPKIPNAIHDKCLIRSFIIIMILKPKSNQQVRTQSNALPPDEHQQVVGSHHQQQHKKYKQIKIGEEPAESCVVVHVTNGVHVD